MTVLNETVYEDDGRAHDPLLTTAMYSTCKSGSLDGLRTVLGMGVTTACQQGVSGSRGFNLVS